MSTRRLGKPVLATTVLGVTTLLVASTAQAQTFEERTIAPSPVRAGDAFGTAVDVAASTVVVGANRDDGRGGDAGTAYLLDAGTGAVVDELRPVDEAPDPDASAGDLFGDSVAVGGGLAVVGAPTSQDAGRQAGAAYVFDASTGQQVSRILPFQEVFVGEDPVGTGYGIGVDVSDTRIAVGAPGDLEAPDGTSVPGAGAVYLYTSDPTGPELVGKFKPDDPTLAANYGRRVALTDDQLAVSAPFDGGFTVQSGSVYLVDPATGDQRQKIVPPDLGAGDFFGLGLDLSDQFLAVGAPFADAAAFNSGAVYVFDATTGEQLLKLVPDDLAADDRFGTSVAVDGTRLLVGAPGGDGDAADTGVVYVFDLQTGDLVDRLVAGDGQADDLFGSAVAAGDGQAFVGAPLDDDRGSNAGAVYQFGDGGGHGGGTGSGDLLVSVASATGDVGVEDVARLDTASGTLSPFIDGSDVGLGGSDVDAVAPLPDGSLLLSLRAPATVDGIQVDDSDVLRFVPTSTGSTTTGTFSLFVDGSDVGLTRGGEDVDGLDVLPGTDGTTLAVSTTGRADVPGLSVRDEDVALLTLTQTGSSTAGTWAPYLDGSDVGLTARSEDVGGVAAVDGDLLLAIGGSFSAGQVTGDGRDVLRCGAFQSGADTRCTLSLEVDGSSVGLGPLDGLAIG